jgi:hypothetical protein
MNNSRAAALSREPTPRKDLEPAQRHCTWLMDCRRAPCRDRGISPPVARLISSLLPMRAQKGSGNAVQDATDPLRASAISLDARLMAHAGRGKAPDHPLRPLSCTAPRWRARRNCCQDPRRRAPCHWPARSLSDRTGRHSDSPFSSSYLWQCHTAPH